MARKKMPKSINLFCKNCGEYAENVVCQTEMDEVGRYKQLSWFEPMNNLEYLEWKSEHNEK